MVERDRLERRGYAPTTPDDLDDPARFGQPTETVKDAVVLELRRFFDQPNLNAAEVERRAEIPTVRKYAVGFGPGTNPYETVQQIVQDHADIGEKLPHVAVTAVTGSNNRLTAGQPFIAHVQNPPRVETANAEPYALASSRAEQWQIVVDTVVVGQRSAVNLNGQDFAYTPVAGDDREDVAFGLRDALRSAEPLWSTALSGWTLTITAAELNMPFTVDTTADLTPTQLQAAGTGGADELIIRSTPDRKNAETDTIQFRAGRFPNSAPVTAARAADVARVINEQARYVHAETFELAGGAGTGVRILSGGKTGGRLTPNEVEVLPSSSSNATTVLGLGAAGIGGPADGIVRTAPGGPMAVSAAGLGAAVLAAAGAGVTAYVTLSGVSEANSGRFPVTAVLGVDSVAYTNAAGRDESFNGGGWFVGRRDDSRNPARPVMNRRHQSFRLTVNLSVLAESPNESMELQDLVLTDFAYYLEERYFSIHGRGIFDPDTCPDELYQISIGQDIAPGGQAVIPREQDGKGPIYEARIAIPMTLFDYQDRAVLVPSGPSAGLSWTLEGANVYPRDGGGTPLPP